MQGAAHPAANLHPDDVLCVDKGVVRYLANARSTQKAKNPN